MDNKKNPPLVRARFAIPALLKFRAANGDVEALASKHGISSEKVWQPDALIPTPSCNAMLSEISRLLKDPFLGATIGAEWATTDGAPFEKAKQRATNLGHLLTLIAIEFSTEATTGKCELKVNADYAVFTGQREYQPGEAAKFGAAAFVSFIVQLIKQSVGELWDIHKVAVVAPSDSILPPSVLPKGSILTGASNLFQFRFPVEWLEEITRYQEASAEAVNSSTTKIEVDLVGSLRMFLQSQLPGGDTSVANAASVFSFSERELQRRLRTVGISYRALLNEEKMAYATRALRSPNASVQEVAEALGYNKTGNFSRAFKAHTGFPPTKYMRIL